jgi:deazaflavin-dependent oxidoreductase (nitroreductase family)
MKDSTAKRLSRLHTVLFRLTRGRIGRRLVNNDMLLLTTTGRRSGKRHTVPLLYLTDGDRHIVIASWGGRDDPPDWYLNLVAEPVSTINVNGVRSDVVARTADTAERKAWWPRAEAAYSGYREYQSRTDREIPVVFLEPRS